MALNSYAALEINGTALTGEVTLNEIAGLDVSDGNLELFAVEWGAQRVTGRDSRSAARVSFEPVVFETRLGRSTPALFQALSEGRLVSGDIRLFDVHQDTGETRHYFTLRLDRAAITSVQAASPDTLDKDTANRPATVIVELTPSTLTYRDEVYNTEYTASARADR